MVLPERLVELLRSGMAMVLFEGGENHHSWTSRLESCSMQSRHSFGHESVLLVNRNHSEFGIRAKHNETTGPLSRGRARPHAKFFTPGRSACCIVAQACL